MTIETAAGDAASGDISLQTGDAPSGSTEYTGAILLSVGVADSEGGSVDFDVGESEGASVGGSITVKAGSSGDSTGGEVYLSSGEGIATSSGSVAIASGDAGENGDSGLVTVATGDATDSCTETAA